MNPLGHVAVLVTIVLCLVLPFASVVYASESVLSIGESESLKVILTISPIAPRRGGTMTLVVKVENEGRAVSGAAVKVLLTFSDNRQNSFSGISNANGAFTYVARIPAGTSPGPGKVDVIVRIGGNVVIQSSSFTVK